MKFYKEIEETADTLGDTLTTLEDAVGMDDYITRDELDKCWDAYDILMGVSMMIGEDENKMDEEIEE